MCCYQRLEVHHTSVACDLVLYCTHITWQSAVHRVSFDIVVSCLTLFVLASLKRTAASHRGAEQSASSGQRHRSVWPERTRAPVHKLLERGAVISASEGARVVRGQAMGIRAFISVASWYKGSPLTYLSFKARIVNMQASRSSCFPSADPTHCTHRQGPLISVSWCGARFEIVERTI